ncbi:tripartite tricarboxylate transporter TctB family protein [Halalkalicoccus sp. NIPERK01]|uniref:tripartite tricarboxylate transporter TctB family protein n=1 Tax=Halalkalicoccus sp. NIPERK01 TaxID=3053469 RepID=UPI00256EFF55|nr:tripartite tricarboxylate transporter TctB family protein [Halalkalicoccus sp. NIPERK01]MDL5362178.1 tripartite tricarboxylate transporter TctB family protein [Halalkalicoccus sp. NIPERK01]
MGVELRHTDALGAGLWLLLAGAVFALSAGFPAGPGETGPAFYPRVIAGLIALFAVVQLVRSLAGDPRAHEITLGSTRRVVGVAVGVLAYVLLLPWLGFVVATALFLVVGMRYSGVDSPLRIGVVAVGLTLGLHYVFGVFLRIPLPESPFYSVARLLPALVGAF